MAKILVMDDDENILLLFRETLAHLGHTLYYAQNGIEGSEIIRHEDFDVIFVDILMPDKDGVEVILEMRESVHPGPPIVAMSGTGAEFLPIVKDLGVTSTLLKPLTRERILAALLDLSLT